MSNPNIGSLARQGGLARMAKLGSEGRSLLAKNAVDSRIRKYKQDAHPALDIDDYNELKRKYVALATFLTSHGYSVQEITDNLVD